MIQNLEVLISFAVVMAGLSLLIMTLNQIISAILSIRGTTLRAGIQVLLENVSPDLSGQAKEISKRLLSHPLVSDAYTAKFKGSIWNFYKMASVIRQKELIGVLKRLRDSAGAQPEPVKNALNQLDDSKLNDIEEQVKIWFDTSMERVSERFAIRMRIWTVVLSFLLVFSLHMDSSKLLNQLNRDPTLRAQLNIAGTALQEQADQILKNPGGVKIEDLQKVQGRADAIVGELSKAGLEIIEVPYRWGDFAPPSAHWIHHLLGILASGAFLSLGAPFWFNLLKSFTNLKPASAMKVEKEDEKRK